MRALSLELPSLKARLQWTNDYQTKFRVILIIICIVESGFGQGCKYSLPLRSVNIPKFIINSQNVI